MGESGEGSLEEGGASGDEFMVTYPAPFLEYYYDANPDQLPSTMRPATVADQQEASGAEEAAGEAAAQADEKPPEILRSRQSSHI